MTDTPKYQVGQTLWLGDMSRREGQPRREVTVTKVGRVLLTVTNQYGQAQVFRMDTGHANNAYGHQWVMTAEEVQDADARSALTDRFIALRVTGPWSRYPVDTLTQVADLLEADTHG